jgi:hypothetical protein
MKGGSPENPQLVSQLKYDLDALYRDVEAVGGSRLHPRHPHGLAPRQVRLRRRRGLLGQGDYQGGLRVVDTSGDLRGDLLRQGRETSHVVTVDSQGVSQRAEPLGRLLPERAHLRERHQHWSLDRQVGGESELVP